jgi:hypothetical protein
MFQKESYSHELASLPTIKENQLLIDGIYAILHENLWKYWTLWLGERTILCAYMKPNGWVKKRKN